MSHAVTARREFAGTYTEPVSADSPEASSPRANDQLLRSVSTGGGVAVRTLVATDLAIEATSRRTMAPTARSVLSRALMGAVLLAVEGKDRETVQLELRGDGPLGRVIATSDEHGRACGTISNPGADPRADHGGPDIATALGRGLLSVSRRRPGWPEPHTGMVVMESSEVARDLALYLTESEQVPSAVGLSVAQSAEGMLETAGGFLVQALPDADPEELARVEANVGGLGSTAELMRAGLGADALMDRLMEGVGTRERHASTPAFFCRCTRERALRTLALLGEAELLQMIEGSESQEVRCEFCGQAYQIAPTELRTLLTVN